MSSLFGLGVSAPSIWKFCSLLSLLHVVLPVLLQNITNAATLINRNGRTSPKDSPRAREELLLVTLPFPPKYSKLARSIVLPLRLSPLVGVEVTGGSVTGTVAETLLLEIATTSQRSSSQRIRLTDKLLTCGGGKTRISEETERIRCVPHPVIILESHSVVKPGG